MCSENTILSEKQNFVDGSVQQNIARDLIYIIYCGILARLKKKGFKMSEIPTYRIGYQKCVAFVFALKITQAL